MEPRERKGPRLFVDGLSSRGTHSPSSLIPLSQADSHYIRDVLRLKVGDPLEIGTKETGDIYQCEITSIDTDVTAKVIKALPKASHASPSTLLCALCKGQKNDQICDWATELGCERIIFFQSDRSVVRLRNTDECSHKAARLSKIATAAAQQSRQERPPEILVTQSLSAALTELNKSNYQLKAWCSLHSDLPSLHSEGAKLSLDQRACVAIGPEGDLTDEEQATLHKDGFISVSLGPNVLRSELATATALITLRNSR
jgi:16S rRNA (uracil1498-N3)-methyltransferase